MDREKKKRSIRGAPVLGLKKQLSQRFCMKAWQPIRANDQVALLISDRRGGWTVSVRAFGLATQLMRYQLECHTNCLIKSSPLKTPEFLS